MASREINTSKQPTNSAGNETPPSFWICQEPSWVSAWRWILSQKPWYTTLRIVLLPNLSFKSVFCLEKCNWNGISLWHSPSPWDGQYSPGLLKSYPSWGFPRKFVGKSFYPRKYWQYIDERIRIFVIQEKPWRILNLIPSQPFKLSRDIVPDVLIDAGDTRKISLEWGRGRARRVWIHWQRDQRDQRDQKDPWSTAGSVPGCCKSWFGNCAKPRMEFPPVQAERINTKSMARWKAGNRTWKIPEQSPFMNSPCSEGTQVLFPDLTNLQAKEFPWSHVFFPSNQEIQALFCFHILVWSLLPSSLVLLNFHPKDFFGMKKSLDKEYKWISSSFPIPWLRKPSCFLLSFPPQFQSRIPDSSTNLPSGPSIPASGLSWRIQWSTSPS